ncbi:hypothetical protein CTEN210_11963 [Chaetoceros tenuissimus]|uniref:NAD(P)-binding domain-containing protein n=1 Tax=Chaetoceros tenuissimus TaxID=426638 RepID=A0AAD3H9E1_9STRA|nr:hypothetical protein CTEN210_11963 [Chaetoceros tenuissimus]
MNLRRSFRHYATFSLLFIIACKAAFGIDAQSASYEKVQKKPTVMLFGSNGAVGSNVLSALLKETISETTDESFWNEIILVGRRFPSTEESKLIKTVSITSLKDIDKNEDELSSIQDTTLDACVIALGVGSPQDMTLSYWHSVEIDMIGSITRLCVQKGAKYISLLSSIDAEVNPVSITVKELEK